MHGRSALRRAWGLRFELADFQQRQKAGQQGASAPIPGYAHSRVANGDRVCERDRLNLFSAAPRRTGKSTFLTQDLPPILKDAQFPEKSGKKGILIHGLA